jgi:hypothetical protein
VTEWFKVAVLKTVTRHSPRNWFTSAIHSAPWGQSASGALLFGQKGTREGRRGRSSGHNPVTGLLKAREIRPRPHNPFSHGSSRP